MKSKIILSLLLIVISVWALLLSSHSDKKEHRHSVVPGSECCDTCGEKIKACDNCHMVNGDDDTSCWFCKSKLE